MPAKAWNIRPAAIHDARAIAEVHVESYKSTYRGILPDEFLDGLSVEKRESFWRDLAAQQSITIVGCGADGSVLGFASGGKERSGRLGCDGELYAIYLHTEAQRKGLGAFLVRQMVQELVALGFRSMAVWVLARNPSTKFYESLGGRVIGQQEIERGGQTFSEVAYGWPGLDAFRESRNN